MVYYFQSVKPHAPLKYPGISCRVSSLILSSFSQKWLQALGLFFLVIWGTLLLSRSMRAKDNQHATQLLYMYNIFTDNVAILGHTIRSMNVSSQVDCFRHCAKVCGCVAFQLTGWKCELLDADKDVVGGDLLTRPGTALYTMNQDSIQVRLCH